MRDGRGQRHPESRDHLVTALGEKAEDTGRDGFLRGEGGGDARLSCEIGEVRGAVGGGGENPVGNGKRANDYELADNVKR